MKRCYCGKIIESGLYCSDGCKKEISRLRKVVWASKPNGYKQIHTNDVLSQRWEMLWRLSPQGMKDLMYKVERQMPLCVGIEEH